MKQTEMKLRTRKGQGGHTARQLLAPQKAQLTIWMHSNKELCMSRTIEELAEKSSDELGFEVSPSSAQTFKNAVHPGLKKIRAPKHARNSRIKLLEQAVQELNDRIIKIEKAFNI